MAYLHNGTEVLLGMLTVDVKAPAKVEMHQDWLTEVSFPLNYLIKGHDHTGTYLRLYEHGS